MLQDEWKTYSVTMSKGQNQQQAKKQNDEDNVEQEIEKDNAETMKNQ